MTNRTIPEQFSKLIDKRFYRLTIRTNNVKWKIEGRISHSWNAGGRYYLSVCLVPHTQFIYLHDNRDKLSTFTEIKAAW